MGFNSGLKGLSVVPPNVKYQIERYLSAFVSVYAYHAALYVTAQHIFFSHSL